jgi:hypothetical protein
MVSMAKDIEKTIAQKYDPENINAMAGKPMGIVTSYPGNHYYSNHSQEP